MIIFYQHFNIHLYLIYLCFEYHFGEIQNTITKY